jgi:hypothetical protein
LRRPVRGGACLLVGFAALLAAGACDSDLDRDPTNQPCPCTSGYVCDDDSNRCVRATGIGSGGEAGSGGGVAEPGGNPGSGGANDGGANVG